MEPGAGYLGSLNYLYNFQCFSYLIFLQKYELTPAPVWDREATYNTKKKKKSKRKNEAKRKKLKNILGKQRR